jgi:hypothetical protein
MGISYECLSARTNTTEFVTSAFIEEQRATCFAEVPGGVVAGWLGRNCFSVETIAIKTIAIKTRNGHDVFCH